MENWNDPDSCIGPECNPPFVFAIIVEFILSIVKILHSWNVVPRICVLLIKGKTIGNFFLLNPPVQQRSLVLHHAHLSLHGGFPECPLEELHDNPGHDPVGVKWPEHNQNHCSRTSHFCALIMRLQDIVGSHAHGKLCSEMLSCLCEGDESLPSVDWRRSGHTWT